MTLNTNFNQSPYFDDFDETKDFYRILFRPGYAVQARELTQVQSILQNQIGKFGDHIFDNGAQVIPGSVNVDPQVHFLKLETNYNSVLTTTIIDQFQHKIITGVDSGVKMRVLDHSNCDCVTTQLEIPTLYCKIETIGDNDTKRLIPGEVIVAYAADNTVANNPELTVDQTGDITAKIRELGDNGEDETSYTGNASSDVIGYGYGVDVKEGIYYIDGFFVRTPELHLYPGRFSNNPTARIGFKVTESFVTPEQDVSLTDQAAGSSNYSAPGAHRYKISVSLVAKDIRSTDDDRFIELLRVVNGTIQNIVDKTDYSELEKTFARRTFDESGNYEVNKFKLSTKEHLDDGTNNGVYSGDAGDPDKFVLVVDSGKAYIEGYEVENTNQKYIAIDKARENGASGEENGQIARVEDKLIPTQIGSYTIVKNVYNYPNISTFETVYLVDIANSSQGTAPASGNIVGTARVRSFQLHSGDYADGTDTEFKLGLFDIKMNEGKTFSKDVKQITGQGSSNIFTCDIDVTQTRITGSASSSTGSATVTGVGTEFLSEASAGDFLYLNNTFVGQIDSIGNDLTITLTSNGAAAVTGGSIKIGRASLLEPEYNSLIFPVGYDYIKTLKGVGAGGNDDEDSTVTTVRRIITGNSSSGSVTFTLTDGDFLSDSDLSNYTLYRNSTHSFVNLTSAMIDYDANNTDSLTISSLGFDGAVTLITSVQQSGVSARARSKTKRTSTDEQVVGKKLVTSNSIELDYSDGYRLVSVKMTNDSNYDTYTASGAVDITNRYELDSGQTATYYGKAKLKLKPGNQVPTGAIAVTYEYFEWGSTGNYFSVDSYVGLDIEDIPSFAYRDSNNITTEITLSSVVDFRPAIDDGTILQIPKIGSSVNSDLAYYLGRKDKVYIDSTGNFVVLSGVPSLQPKEPDDPKNGMVLCTLTLRPYTATLDDIIVKQRENRRYTMKDIGKIEKRVRNLEYYTSLSLLEKQTKDLQIKDNVTGIDRFKNGFIVDSFTGHGIGNVKDKDYRVAVDATNKILRPMHYTTAVEIVEDIDSGSARASQGYQKTGDLITLPYTETDLVFNPYGTRYLDVNPYKIGAFKGEVQLIPEGDNWKDEDRRPDLLVTDDNNFDAIKYMADELGVTGSFWDEWETNWTGLNSSRYTEDWQSGWQGFRTTYQVDEGITEREGVEISFESSTNKLDYGDRVVDISYASKVRSNPVTFLAKNLKPNTRFFPFFDGISVAHHVKPADVFKLTRTSSVMSFDPAEITPGIRSDDYERSYNGVIYQCYMAGDILKNAAHTAIDITAIANPGANSYDVDVTVSSTTGISVGHHVRLYNLDFNNAITGGLNDPENDIPASENITDTDYTAPELNLIRFKVTGITGNVLTLTKIDQDNYLPATVTYTVASGYNTGALSGETSGMLLRLRASCVAMYGGYVHNSDTNGASVQDVHVMNVKNGFAVNDTLTGSTTLATSGNVNTATLTAINGGTSTISAPTMTDFIESGDTVNDFVHRSDEQGNIVGLFIIPNNDSINFNVGEKVFKLTDNSSNTDLASDSKGSISYFAMGTTISKEKTIVNSRTGSFVEDRLYESIPARRVTPVSTRLLWDNTPSGDGGGGHDPLAQTFTVNAAGGAFVTSADLYFESAGKRPVIVELRTTAATGIPSTKILPFSTVVKQPSEINTSNDGSVATTFTFESPIYLQQGETYTLVVKVDEPGCTCWVSELGQTDAVTNNIVTKQPLTGSLYLSQNSKEFEINPLLDLKFDLKKAKFDISSTVNVPLRAVPPKDITLSSDPFEITPNTNLVRVYAPNHGLKNGDTVRISGVADNNYGTSSATTGIPASVFNTTHTVYASGIDRNSFIINLDLTKDVANDLLVGISDNTSFIKGMYGGNGVKISRNLDMDAFYLKTSDVILAKTEIKYAFKSQNHGSLGSAFPDSWTSIQPNSNYFFETRRLLRSFDNQTVVTANLNRSSLIFQGTLSSSNENLSPVIDLQKLSAYSITNLIDDQSFDDVNVAAIDERVMISTISQADAQADGSGSITITNNDAEVTGTGFNDQINEGDKIYLDAGDTLVGTVESVTDDNNLELTAAYSGSTDTIADGDWYIVGAARIEFYNNAANTQGIIETSVDAADNILANCTIGNHIKVTDAQAEVNGDDYTIQNILVDTETSINVGNADGDRVRLFVTPSFAIDGLNSANVTVDMINDSDFEIVQYDKFVEDFAPVGSHNAANYMTRTLEVKEAADSIKILFDASIVKDTKVKVLYRTWYDDINLDTLPYIDTGYDSTTAYDSEGVFSEREINIEDIDPFLKLAIKVVLKSTNPAKVPQIKNLRLIAHS